MSRFRSFIKTSLLGGIMVILPVAVLLFLFSWIFGLIQDFIRPFTAVLTARSGLDGITADVIVLMVLFVVCFGVGIAIRTRVGRYVHDRIEHRVLRGAPGYSLIKETIVTFFGRDRMPFAGVALVRPFESGALMTGFITDTHPDGSYTVFLPTGPNPTSGFIFHCPEELVTPLDVPVEVAMRTVISCGAGSTTLIEAFVKRRAGAALMHPPPAPGEAPFESMPSAPATADQAVVDEALVSP